MLKNIVKELRALSSTLKINEISRELENKGKKIFTSLVLVNLHFQYPIDIVEDLQK